MQEMDVMTILKEGRAIVMDFEESDEKMYFDFPGGTVICHIKRIVQPAGDDIQVQFKGTPEQEGAVMALLLKPRKTSVIEVKYLMFEKTGGDEDTEAKFLDYDRFKTIWCLFLPRL
ncbi:MAG: hypothetical protein A3B74_01465 [Candidatus Kerfeldbacteria bacterium RIFCSPHIGHO2_02_FULL_42_14]|uniref:Uncharacterized protein n=1 Tax=Candidatus Kerfeldbacteria bacterium RIFCSPHIGHO2_02_FULL_42_14 TaxID=1798540 RepID=A0A1G2AQD5_9BACT|nr:MAG: hypothetical protein A3B74_01465 [Candidatus Kerfeldbacteria bacterium RIFCSPHIGHO2_02_FULL_42_14]OGY81228.1 MAG: hypothetical protein A3E60_02980 [Candidatus Kerfeldbacteria bacterium RIFCSPHIGHO2_12_FULL_42_13]OGY83352.1 MAG: hypothetical protein A3I91_01730 [Candidatus Kerfeldbacteria bacterium RIFCSPLOWO2_02_FULL_42_19]